MNWLRDTLSQLAQPDLVSGDAVRDDPCLA